jgi:hypothetical protein
MKFIHQPSQFEVFPTPDFSSFSGGTSLFRHHFSNALYFMTQTGFNLFNACPYGKISLL